MGNSLKQERSPCSFIYARTVMSRCRLFSLVVVFTRLEHILGIVPLTLTAHGAFASDPIDLLLFGLNRAVLVFLLLLIYSTETNTKILNHLLNALLRTRTRRILKTSQQTNKETYINPSKVGLSLTADRQERKEQNKDVGLLFTPGALVHLDIFFSGPWW